MLEPGREAMALRHATPEKKAVWAGPSTFDFMSRYFSGVPAYPCALFN